MNWLKKAHQIRQAQVPSAQEVITGLVAGSWTLQDAIDALRRMVSQDQSVCQIIQAEYVNVSNGGVPPQVVRSLEALSQAVCRDVQQQQQAEQQKQKQMQMLDQNQPQIENAEMPESEEFR